MATYANPIMKKLKEVDFYPTPEELYPVLDKVIGRPEKVFKGEALEPSVGTGALLKYLKSRGSASTKAYEKEEMIRMMNPFKDEVEIADFLSVAPERKYDAILMNPPFGRAFSEGIKHLRHAFKFLNINNGVKDPEDTNSFFLGCIIPVQTLGVFEMTEKEEDKSGGGYFQNGKVPISAQFKKLYLELIKEYNEINKSNYQMMISCESIGKIGNIECQLLMFRSVYF